MKARKWFDLAWPELADLATPADAPGPHEVGLVPVGAVEQHGPHLPTGTDTIIATALCDLVSERCGALVLPAISVGCSYGHHVNLPGNLSLSPEQLATVARQYAEWAATSGLTRLIFVNAHFGNAAALNVATDHLRMFRPDLRTAVANWWTLDPTVAAESTSDGDDLHANRTETATMMHLAPELVHLDRLADADDPDRTEGLVFRYTVPSLSTNGVTGRPSEATSELGAKLVGLTVDALVDLVERGRVEQPPLGPATVPSLYPYPPTP